MVDKHGCYFIKEFVEQAYESKNNAGYRDSHKYAQNRYKGDLWIEEWDN